MAWDEEALDDPDAGAAEAGAQRADDDPQRGSSRDAEFVRLAAAAHAERGRRAAQRQPGPARHACMRAAPPAAKRGRQAEIPPDHLLNEGMRRLARRAQARWQLLMLRPRGVAGRKAGSGQVHRAAEPDRDADREADGSGKDAGIELERDTNARQRHDTRAAPRRTISTGQSRAVALRIAALTDAESWQVLHYLAGLSRRRWTSPSRHHGAAAPPGGGMTTGVQCRRPAVLLPAPPAAGVGHEHAHQSLPHASCTSNRSLGRPAA